MLDKKEMALDEKIAELEKQQGALKVREQELQGLFNQAREKLQQVASMSQDEARKILMHQVEEELKHETGALIRRSQDEAKENCGERCPPRSSPWPSSAMPPTRSAR